MEIERIKELFFSTITNYPFPSSELYLFFGFSRHNNFIRVLNKEEYKSDVTIKPWEKVQQRRSGVYFITRNLFYIFCQKFLKDYNNITQAYLEYKREALKSKILNFAFYKKPEYPKLDICKKLKGHFYTYNLNTLNISKDLNVDVYDLFKFCSLEFCSKYDYKSARCTNEYGMDREAAYPYYSFDDIKHETRYLFIKLLETVFEKYKLTDFQKQVIKIYSGFVKLMLEKQVVFDIKEHRREKKQKTFTFYFNYKPALTKEQKAELKVIYRKAAMLCHPDKNKNGEEIFKNLNNANKNNDLQKVKEIFSRLS
jgi:hypothetical protein